MCRSSEAQKFPSPPTTRLRPHPRSFVPRSKKSKIASTLEVCLSLCSGKIRGQLKRDRIPIAGVFDFDQRVVLQNARDESWQDPFICLGLSVTPLGEQPEAPTALQDQQWRCMRKGNSHQLRAGGTCTNCGSTLYSSISRAIWVTIDSNDTC